MPATVLNDYPEDYKIGLLAKADRILKGDLTFFQKHIKHVGSPPQWFYDPFSSQKLTVVTKHWTQVTDFDLNTGDIKCIWEPSRFDWLDVLARAYRVTGNETYLLAINQWLQDWALHNPVNMGPNWKCGQEASLRLLKMLHVAFCLSQLNQMSEVLCQFIFQHLERIAGNTRYAIAQQNNHGISEAAGLYLGSCALLHQNEIGYPRQVLLKWKNKGRKLLQSQLLKLIAKDGTFAQKSTNYHRLVMDVLSQSMHLMREFKENDFPSEVIEKLRAMKLWLYSMICNQAGEAPFLGANDGAQFEQSHQCPYSDFRPSLQLFGAALDQSLVFGEGPWNEAVYWRYGKDAAKFQVRPLFTYENKLIDADFLILTNSYCKVIVKIPNDNFRPANDPFHMDVWVLGKNLLTSPGSYSYHSSLGYPFSSVSSHNTVQFGNSEPMPRLGRFLNGNWIKAACGPISNMDDVVTWEGNYTDSNGNHQIRNIRLSGYSLRVEDKCLGLSPIIHWHIPSVACKGQVLPSWFKIRNGKHNLSRGYRSNFYMEKEELVKVKIIPSGGSVVSEILFNELEQ